jgi:hypothetical protein
MPNNFTWRDRLVANTNRNNLKEVVKNNYYRYYVSTHTGEWWMFSMSLGNWVYRGKLEDIEENLKVDEALKYWK